MQTTTTAHANRQVCFCKVFSKTREQLGISHSNPPSLCYYCSGSCTSSSSDDGGEDDDDDDDDDDDNDDDGGSHTPITNDNIHDAVKSWCQDSTSAAVIYGNIKHWNTSAELYTMGLLRQRI